MRITQEADYALRIVLALSKRGKNVRLDAKSIAEEEKVPQRFALKILRKLVKHGLVHSYRGVHGGYAISKTPSEIAMLDVIYAIDGPVCINKCLEDEDACHLKRASYCPLNKALSRIQCIINKELEYVTFAQLVENNPIA